MISLMSGNSRVLLTIDERGNWAQLYYPFPGLHQHLVRARLGIFDEDAKSFAWVGLGAEPRTEAGYLGESNVARTRIGAHGLDLVLDDLVHPNLDLVIRRIRI